MIFESPVMWTRGFGLILFLTVDIFVLLQRSPPFGRSFGATGPWFVRKAPLSYAERFCSSPGMPCCFCFSGEGHPSVDSETEAEPNRAQERNGKLGKGSEVEPAGWRAK